MNNYTVYIHLNKINNKRYIGITKQKPQERWGVNGHRYKKSNPYFYNAIEKYGWDNFEHIIYKSGLNKEDACELEIKLIKDYKTQNKLFGYNLESGGVAPNLNEETKKKISNSHKKCPVYCEETNEIYESIQMCAKKLNIPATVVCRCCKGKSKTAYKYHLKYYKVI